MAPATKTMFEIEREARWRVWALFGLLLLMVYACVWVVVLVAEAVIDALNASARHPSRRRRRSP